MTVVVGVAVLVGVDVLVGVETGVVVSEGFAVVVTDLGVAVGDGLGLVGTTTDSIGSGDTTSGLGVGDRFGRPFWKAKAAIIPLPANKAQVVPITQI